jgi:hypothetical protein
MGKLNLIICSKMDAYYGLALIMMMMVSQSHAQCWEIDDVFYCPSGRETSKLQEMLDSAPQMIALLAGILTLVLLVKCWPSEERDLVRLLRGIGRDRDQASRRRMIALVLNTEISRNPTRDRASLLAYLWRLVDENHLAVVANDLMMLQRQEEDKQE